MFTIFFLTFCFSKINFLRIFFLLHNFIKNIVSLCLPLYAEAYSNFIVTKV